MFRIFGIEDFRHIHVFINFDPDSVRIFYKFGSNSDNSF